MYVFDTQQSQYTKGVTDSNVRIPHWRYLFLAEDVLSGPFVGCFKRNLYICVKEVVD
jgi:hypothetical protein